MPSNYLHKFNTDNVHARAVIVGLVNLLNSKVQFENIYSDTEFSIVTVPFYYNFGGDERFLQDYFLQWNECVTPQMVDGNVDPIPRGIVTLTSSTINTNQLTNRFVRGNYVKQVGNEVLTYNAFLNPIPLTMNFEVTIHADTSLDAFKIQQSVLETFYKTQVFSVEFRGFRVPCQVGFPEDQGIEKTFEFTYQTETDIKFNVPLQLETYFPVTDPTTERFGGNRLNYPGGPNIEWSSDERYAKPRFNISAPVHNESYFSSGTMNIEWTNTGPITRVNLYWRIANEVDWIPIVKNLQNTGSYTWKLPFLDANGSELPAGETTRAFVTSSTGEDARIRAIIDALGQVESIIIFNGGSGYQGSDAIQVDDPTVVTLPPTISPRVISGTLVGADIYATGANFLTTPVNRLEIKVENSNDERVYEIMKREITYQATVTNGSAVLTNIVPNISVAQNLADLALYPGMPVIGAGIPAGATISYISPATNEIHLTTNANGNYPITLISGGYLYGNVTLK